jgi:hypothetical protein
LTPARSRGPWADPVDAVNFKVSFGKHDHFIPATVHRLFSLGSKRRRHWGNPFRLFEITQCEKGFPSRWYGASTDCLMWPSLQIQHPVGELVSQGIKVYIKPVRQGHPIILGQDPDSDQF